MHKGLLLGWVMAITLSVQAFVYDTEQKLENHVERGTSLTDTLSDTTALADTLPGGTQADPTYHTLKVSNDSLDQPVTYKATDSLVYDISGKQIILYGEAEVKYGNISLAAPRIIFDWQKGTVFAYSEKDSVGNWVGKPQFSEGERSFSAEEMRYNFQSKKGKIFSMSTQEGEGFILSEEAKKDEEDNLFARRAKYTTCDAEHPHFYIEASPVKIVPNEILVSGPSNLVIAGVRTPLVLPFALFPLQQGQRSGLIVPEIGESQNLGFALQNGGYYFGINDYIDLSITGDLYTTGSYRLRLNSRYAKKYRYRGNIGIEYGNLRFGDELRGNLSVQQSFSVRWNYTMDPKAWPNNNFSANVNIASSNYNQLNVTNVNQRLNNSFNSSVNYSRNFRNKPFNFNMSLRHSQNTSTREVRLVLPEANFGVSRINPFKRKISSGQPKWYENIGFNYSLNTRNSLTAIDSNLFEQETLRDFRLGFQHQLPVSANFKVFKYFTLSPNISYTENWFFERFSKRYDPIDVGDSLIQYVQTDTAAAFTPVRFFNTALSLTTRLYGRANFKKGKIKAIRHVVTPRLSLNYRPDFGAEQWGYYRTVQTDPDGNTETYATFPTDLYGQPPRGLVGGVGFNINNNLEMKVFDRKDTVNQEKKIKIFDAFDINGFYNFARDSLQLDNIRLSGRTTLLGKVNLVFSAVYDPYILKADGSGNLNRFEWAENRRPARLENADLNVSFQLASNKKEKNTEEGFTDLEERPEYLDIPWNLSARYSLRLNKGVGSNLDSVAITQSLGFDVNFTLSPSWRVAIGSGYDFVQNEFTYTVVDISRDLHCWEMRFRWIPFGFLRSYTFGINVKSTILRDLKVEKKSNPYDNFQGL